MVKKLARAGEDLALVLDKALLERLGIDAETPLEVSTDGEVIVIAPVRDEARAAKLERVTEDAHRRYANVFRRLAE